MMLDRKPDTPERVCGHCGHGTYEEPEYRECHSRDCVEPICDACDSVQCDGCEADLHWGCALRVGDRILCEECGARELDKRGVEHVAA